MTNYVNEYKNAFNNNRDNNVTLHKGRHTPIINQFQNRDTLGVFKQIENLIPG